MDISGNLHILSNSVPVLVLIGIPVLLQVIWLTVDESRIYVPQFKKIWHRMGKRFPTHLRKTILRARISHIKLMGPGACRAIDTVDVGGPGLQQIETCFGSHPVPGDIGDRYDPN